ncbi:MAG: hypothetical protein CFE23_16480 [Flavobacterium sp. BFFFF1]|nr:MAG: hypothetical protein CFE23_16480 [Flavobacterium sp. BFFFF1]
MYAFDAEIDDHIFYYPKIHFHYWIKLPDNTKTLSSQLHKLYQYLNIEYLVFMCDYNRMWISKFTEQRNDSKKLTEAVNYFKSYKIGNRFNGGVKVEISQLEEFIKHVFTITVCDASFANYHFINEEQKILGFIHYSGEVRIDILDKNANEIFLNEISKTKFINVIREHTDKI